MLRQAAPLGADGHIWNIENVDICKMAVKGLPIHKMVATGDIIIYKTAVYFNGVFRTLWASSDISIFRFTDMSSYAGGSLTCMNKYHLRIAVNYSLHGQLFWLWMFMNLFQVLRITFYWTVSKQ